MKYLKIIFIALIVLILVSVCYVLVNAKSESQSDKMDVLAILPLSGSGADTGNLVLQGMNLAVNDLGKDGKINLIVEDSQTNKAVAVTAYNSKVDKDTAVVLTVLSTTGMVLSPLAEDKNIPLIGTVVTASNFTTGKNWTYRFFPDASVESKVMLSDLKMLDANSVGLIYVNDEYGTSVKNIIVSDRNDIVSESFNTDEVDYKSHITKLIDKNVLIVVGYISHLKPIFSQLKELGYKGKIISTGTFASKDMVNYIGKDDVVYVAATDLYREDNSNGKKFLTEFKAKYGKDADHYSAIGYDLIMYLNEITKDKTNISPAEIKQLLDKRMEYDGAIGKITASHMNLQYDLFPAKIEHNQLVYLK